MTWSRSSGVRLARRFPLAFAALACGLLATALQGQVAQGAEASGQAVAPGTINTFAGSPGGPARATRVALMPPCAVTYSGGHVYSTDPGPGGYLVSQISTRTERLVTVAGNGGFSPVTNGGLASGELANLCGVTVDHHGNLLLSARDCEQPGCGLIRVVARRTGSYYGQSMLVGHIYTIAGTGVGIGPDVPDGAKVATRSGAGLPGNGGPALDASITYPSGIVVDSTGNVIFADSPSKQVDVVAATTGTFYGMPMAAGDIYAVAGTGASGISGDGCVATQARLDLVRQAGIALDPEGNLVIATGTALRVVAATSGRFYGTAMKAGHIYTIAANRRPSALVGCVAGADRKAVIRSGFQATLLAVDRVGNLVVTGRGYLWVDAMKNGTFYGRRMMAGHIYQIIRTGVVNRYSRQDVAIDGAGNVVLTAGLAGGPGSLRVLANRNGRDFGLRMRAGRVYTVAGNGQLDYSGDGGPATSAQLGTGLTGLATDSRGNFVLANAEDHRLRVIAARTGRFYGQQMTAGDIYTISGDGRTTSKRDTGPAAGIAVTPFGVAASRDGDLAVTGSVSNRGLIWLLPTRSGQQFGRKMTANHVYVLARCPVARCLSQEQPAFDSAGNVIANVESSNDRVVVIARRTGTFYGHAMKAGHQYVLAGLFGAGNTGNGGPATHASVSPGPVTVDHHGNVLLASAAELRVVAASTGTFYGVPMQKGDIYQLQAFCCEQDGQGPPGALAVDAGGNVILTEDGPIPSEQVDVFPATSGTFYGVPMTAGQLTKIAGDGYGFSGDGGPALSAQLAGPFALTITASGDILFGDVVRIRSIAG